MYPPNTVALACLYTSALLLTLETPPPSNPIDDSARHIVSLLKEKADWEQTHMVEAEDLQGQCLISGIMYGMLILTAIKHGRNRTSHHRPSDSGSAKHIREYVT